MKAETKPVESYEDLLNEKQRLQLLIENQKNIVRHDFQELRSQFRKELRPALDAANFVRRFTVPEKRNQTLLTLGIGFAIDFSSRLLLQRSNVFVRTIIPMIAKGVSTKFLSRNNGHKSTNQP